jgi:hypothetical protein
MWKIEAHSRYHGCRGKATSITYSEYVSVALLIQHPKCMSGIILSSVACLTLPYYSTLFHKWQGFRGGKKVTEHEKCVLIFCTFV